MEGQAPVHKHLRIDNRCQRAKVTRPSGSRATAQDYADYISTGAIAYLLPATDDFVYEFTLIEIYGGAELTFDRNNTIVRSGEVVGDDTGYLHVAPNHTLDINKVSPYKRLNVTWAPYIYENASFILPPATIEFRQSFDWTQFYPQAACPSSMLISSHVSIWGTLDGSRAHLLVGSGGTLTMELPSPRNLQFVEVTVQEDGLFELKSYYGQEDDHWQIEVTPGEGEGQRSGRVTVEGGGTLKASVLDLRAHSVVVDDGGAITADSMGLIDGPGASPAGMRSGAGYGGIGGKGRSSDTVGVVYGSLHRPTAFGSGGGTGGAKGGGILQLTVDTTLQIEGVVRANGASGTTNRGGGSGGSIWITTKDMEGAGTLQVRGGSGGTNGGGGGGGRLAVYYRGVEWWFGDLQAYGGSGTYGPGGAGTVYLENLPPAILNRTLIVDNNNQPPPVETITTDQYAQPSLDSSRSWVHDDDEDGVLEFEHVRILRKAHLVTETNLTQLKVDTFSGDHSSFMHIGDGQVFVGHFADDSEFNVNVHVYEGGLLILPPTFTCYDITIVVRGTISVHDLTIGKGCRLLLSQTGTSRLLNDTLDTSVDLVQGNLAGHYRFDSLTVAANGEVTSVDDGNNVLDNFTLSVQRLKVEGGGHLHTKRMEINADVLIVDDMGRLVADLHDLPCPDSDGAGKSGSGNNGGSGAGHGGRGGRSSHQRKTGAAFGHVFEPSHLGCKGGGPNGGRGGGKMVLNIAETLKVDGEVSADGESATGYGNGGGSGGSIWINTNHMQGYGRVTVNGGAGHVSGGYQGGGGSAGRIAVYFALNRTFSGSFEAHGGQAGGQGAGVGGPGTMFFYHTGYRHRTLIVNNLGKGPKEDENVIIDYHDLSEDESRAWLLPSSGDHDFAGDQQYYFEEFQLYGRAHLAILTDPPDSNASIYFENMIGDRTGTLHVGNNQSVDLYRPTIDLPFNVHVYVGGHLGLAPITIVHGVTIFLNGALTYVESLTLHHQGRFWLNKDGHTGTLPSGQYEFQLVHVQDDGYIHMISDPVQDPGMNFTVVALQVDGGGLVEGTHLYVHAENITIDAGGQFSADGQGYSVQDGGSLNPDGSFREGLHGIINFGMGQTGTAGSSGAGHGGSGGHGRGIAKTGQPYSDLYEPEEFGSVGGGTSGGSGGGRIWFNVTDTILIDGLVSANGIGGGTNTPYNGGGSGGSIWMHCEKIKGYGTIATNGGSGSSRSGGGAGGRVALYFRQNATANGFKYESHGGAPGSDCDECEGGGPGTIFLYHLFHDHRTLFLENAGYLPRVKAIDWDNLEEDGCRAWILPFSGMHDFAGEKNMFHFEELQIYDGAHMAVNVFNDSGGNVNLFEDFSDGMTVASSKPRLVTLFFQHMIGDRTGTIHVGDLQEMDLEREEIDLPFSVHVYYDGHLGLAPKTVVHGVEIHMAGLLSHVLNLTLHHGGYMWLQHGGRTTGSPFSHYDFQFVRIQDDAKMEATTDTITEPGITFQTRVFLIEGGGLLHGTHLTLLSENITVDAGGKLAADALGYDSTHFNDTHFHQSLHGDVNPGRPHVSTGVGSGAGHGGSGGISVYSPSKTSGFAYGDLYEPYMFGSSGGLGISNAAGGRGGGLIWMNVTDTIEVDGEVTANGGSADGNGGGGGSGGSIWVYCHTIKGYGRFAVDGGDGSPHPTYPGSGGAGGRFGMYFVNNETATGFNYHSRGGKAGHATLAENGGGGTAFIYHMVYDHRTLIIDNGGLEPLNTLNVIETYHDLSSDSCRTWILPQSGVHYFANGNFDYHFEELQIYGAAHVAILTHPVDTNATLFFLYMIGDRSGTFHIGRNQVLDLYRPEIDLPFSARVYAGGFLGLAPFTIVHGVSIWLHGVLAHVENMTLHHGGLLSMEHGGRTRYQDPSHYDFEYVRIQDNARILGITEPVGNPGIFFNSVALFVEGGGLFHGTRLWIQSTNVTIDDGGSLNVDAEGYSVADAQDIPNSVNLGRGFTNSSGSSGGGHGGTSGRGAAALKTGQAYGSLYEPYEFGSSGGGANGGSGGGIVFLNISDTFQNDGILSADGSTGGDGSSGSGSGGSILIECFLIKGTGVVAVNGGAQSNTLGGAGSGGRTALYFHVNQTFLGQFQAHGGKALGSAESGGPGTVFFYHMGHQHRTLLVENANLDSQHVVKIATHTDISQDSFKAWLLPQSGEHYLAGGDHDYHFEELQIYGNAHLAIQTDPYDAGASLFFRHMIGDRSGVVHIGPNQVMDLRRDFIDIPFSVYIYQLGYLGLAPDTVMSYIFVNVEGRLDHIHNLTLYNGASLQAHLTGSTNDLPRLEYRYNGTTIVKANSVLNFSAPFAHPEQYLLHTGNLVVEGGGLVYAKNLRIECDGNMTVDDGGNVDVSDGGFLTNLGQAPGVPHRLGNSGASHGGIGGRGPCDGFVSCRLKRNLPYGNMLYPASFGSGGAGSRGGIGGGILDIAVDGILRVDGHIRANSLDIGVSSSQSGASGGSGGSILIYAGALTGGHTGGIQANGGSGDSTAGSGSGGRVAVYHTSNVTHDFFQGAYNVQGGPVHSPAEAGASGTFYLKNLHTGFSVLRVDNTGRRPVNNEIENVGQRLDISNVPASYSKTASYTASSGITVTSSSAVYNRNPHYYGLPNDGTSYILHYLFDQTLNNDIHQYFLSTSSSTTITINLKAEYFVNTIRVYPVCSFPTKFKVQSSLNNVVRDVTSNYVLPSSSCYYGSFADLPVRWNANKLIFLLASTQSSGYNYAAMSEIEIYVGGENVYDRYKHRELDSARTWIEPETETNSYEFDELYITGRAQLAVVPMDNLTSDVDVYVGELFGDTTGFVHVGYAQDITVNVTHPDLPFNSRIYESGQMNMPPRAFFKGVEMKSSGKVTGIDDLFVFDGGYVSVDTNGSIGEYALSGEIQLSSIHVQDRGTFELFSYDKHIGVDIDVTNMTVYGGGLFKSNDRFNLTAAHLVAVYSGGEINLDHGGYITKEVRGQGYEPSEGPGQGYGSGSGSSGGGHGGSGGRGGGQSLVGLAYGSIYYPVDYGSTGGYGQQYGQLYFGDETLKNIVVRRGIGGRGGGALKITTRHMIIDGVISANGETPDSTHSVHAGGGSGGSIWIDCEELDGYGHLSADGGNGRNSGGGGAAGRVAVYHQTIRNFNGTISAGGGSSAYEVGGAGTVYIEQYMNNVTDANETNLNETRVTLHKTLKINNNGRPYPHAATYSHGDLRNLLNGEYDDITRSGGITWLWHSSNSYNFDEVHVHGNAHIAILSDTSAEVVQVRGGKLFGDRSAVLHVGRNQTFGFDWVDIYFAANVMLYRYGQLELPPRLSMRDVWMEINGTLADVGDFTVDSGGMLHMWSYGNSRDQPPGRYECVNMTVRSDGKLEMLTVQDESEFTFELKRFVVNAGGYVRTNQLHVIAEDLTIDVAGDFHADFSGHALGQGRGFGQSTERGQRGGSGGGHGGRGGRSSRGIYSSDAYGSIYRPRDMGSGGGVGSQDDGGRGGGTLLLDISDDLRVEGRLHGNGENSHGNSGAGAGGSILAYVNHLDGAGTIETRGGQGSSYGGGGSGGRIAIYYTHYNFIGDFLTQGGNGPDHAVASGTVYLEGGVDPDQPTRKLIVDNKRASAGSSTIDQYVVLPLNSGNSYSSMEYHTYGGVKIRSDGAPYHTSGNGYYHLSSIFSGTGMDGNYYLTGNQTPKITISFFNEVYAYALRVYPQCNSHLSDFKISSQIGSQTTDHTNGYVDVTGCRTQQEPNQYSLVLIDSNVDKIFIDLSAHGSYAAMNKVEVLVQRNPTFFGAEIQPRFAVVPGTLIVGEDEDTNTFEFDEVIIRGQGALAMTSKYAESPRIVAHTLSGDRSGLLTLFWGQVFDATMPRALLPFSLLALDGTTVTLPTILDCKNVEIAIDGSLHSMDRFTISSGCKVSLEYKGGGRNYIDHLDVKTFGSMYINDNQQGTVTIEGTTLNVRSGALLKSSDLNLHYVNVSVEPSATLSIAFATHFKHEQAIGTSPGIPGTPGSSGAGHASNGGSGQNQPRVGATYGSFLTPDLFGSDGGYSTYPHLGGSGSGRVYMNVTGILTVDGTLAATGGAYRSPGAGGGSGGSIWIETETLDGDGVIEASGGDGYSGSLSQYGGGGAGGRIAVYYTNNHFIGDFEATGGASSYEPGGPGTVYLHKLQPRNGTTLLDATSDEAQITHDSNVTEPLTNRTLYINNRGRRPRDWNRNITDGYADYASVPTIVWLTPTERAQIDVMRNDHTHNFTEDVILDELHVYGGAQLAFLDPEYHDHSLDIRIGSMSGDRSGKMLIGWNQTLYVANAHFPVDMDLYRGGLATLHGELKVAGVRINIEGVLENAENITVADGGTLLMHEMINMEGEPTETLDFHTINIRNHGTMTAKNGRDRRTLDGQFIQVYGGGQLTSTNLHIVADVVIVDSKGSISVDDEGFSGNTGLGGGFTYGNIGTGATHGGEGGCQSSSQLSPPAYGSFTTPAEYGSGGGNSGGAGGGILSMNVSQSLRVEGAIQANGGRGMAARSGGGSGGSVHIYAEYIEGSGLFQVWLSQFKY
ncbi:uncharacterized protein LOC119725183 [Patiria miniata]|uniref:Tenascin-X n=1 Tax=Patiria miniata TaxID=46514 RepID=A0A913ZKZ5_PATMI|nr:uncharacterized protein LOC119725183 [Patiria miniata]